MYEVTTRHFIIATAGHVDHGKSALVKALTGTDPDRLPEEKKRQITIDLGFAALNVTAPNGDKIQAGIVDVPGHEDFVRNMIAGIGSIDLALFVVAADDGWMPQSEEHLQILNYLGVQRAVIALTKTDLGAIDVATNQIRERLSDTAFADSPIVPTSVRTGAGIENLVNTLASQLARTEPQRDVRKPRLFIDPADPCAAVRKSLFTRLSSKHGFARFRAMARNWKSRTRECVPRSIYQTSKWSRSSAVTW